MEKENKLAIFGTLLCLAVFAVHVIPWALSELWYDEVLTLRMYCLGSESPLEVCRNYVIANNHILMNVVNWLWVRTINFNLNELLLRLPAILCGIGTMLLVTCHWRKFIGERLAFLGGVLLAGSPVFLAFAYQMRGYSLTMLLSALAVSGMLEIANGRQGFGQFCLCLAALLQPLVMPSAAMMAAVPVLWLAWHEFTKGEKLQKIIMAVMPVCVFTVLGFSYYFTLWPQFKHAAVDAGGWPSSWLVAAHLLLAFAAHLGLLVLPAIACVPKLGRGGWRQASASAIVMLVAVAFTAAVPLCLRSGGHAPFPRVFLPLLPFVTLAGLQALGQFPKICDKKLMYLALPLLLWGLALERVTDSLTKREIAQGKMPQNLLMQYYRGSDDNTRAVIFLHRTGLCEGAIVLVNEYDEPAFSYYWTRLGLDPQFVVARNRLETESLKRRLEAGEVHLFVLARNEDEAFELFDQAGCRNFFHVVAEFDGRKLYMEGEAQPVPRSELIDARRII